MQYPNLKGAVEMMASNGQKLCIHRAAAFVLDMPGSELCFGTLRAATPLERLQQPGASPVPFIHAWGEYKGKVYAPTTIEAMGGLVPINRELYYDVNGIKDVHRLSRKDVLRISGEIGFSAHVRHGKPTRGGVSVGAAFLSAAGVQWVDGDDGGILPAEENA